MFGFKLIFPASPVIEIVMNKVGTAAAMLKARLDMIYDVRSDEDGRSFSACMTPFFRCHPRLGRLFSSYGPVEPIKKARNPRDKQLRMLQVQCSLM